MLEFLFGWRKASKCKKLIKRTQCRLKLLKSKRLAVIRLLKEDIAQLLKNGHEQIAFNKLDQLYMAESIMSIYEMLNTFSEFILLNLTYIRRRKDLPNDVNEAISTLIFASARFGDLPELRVIRKLFAERYGQRFVTAAVELCLGNLVNCQVKEKFSSQEVPGAERNRMVDEIVRDYFFKPGQLAIEYKTDIPVLLEKVTEPTEVQEKDTESKDIRNSNFSIVLHSPSIAEAPAQSKVRNLAQLNPPYKHTVGAADVKRLQDKESLTHSSENSAKHPEESIVYLDDVEEFRPPSNQRTYCADQDQRFFMFKMETPKQSKDGHQNVSSYPEEMCIDHENIAKKRMRRRSVSKEKQTVNDAQREIYYSSSPGNRRKYQKKIHDDELERVNIQGQSNKNLQPFDCACKLQCRLYQPCYFYANNDRGYDMLLLRQTKKSEELAEYNMVLASPVPQTQRRISMDSPSMRKCLALRPCPYVRATTMPQRHEQGISKEILRSSSLPVENGFMELNSSRNSGSPRYVHPKLPDYDEIAAKFRALKKAHQLTKSPS